MITEPQRLTAGSSYFEDFSEGDLMRHARGRTITETDNVAGTLLAMNTAEGHFNEEVMKASIFGQRVVFGGVTIAHVIGLAAQDTGENVLREQALDKIRLRSPVFHGDTLTAYSLVLSCTDDGDPLVGEIRFRHFGRNQRDEIVFSGERTVRMKKRAFWELLHAGRALPIAGDIQEGAGRP